MDPTLLFLESDLPWVSAIPKGSILDMSEDAWGNRCPRELGIAHMGVLSTLWILSVLGFIQDIIQHEYGGHLKRPGRKRKELDSWGDNIFGAKYAQVAPSLFSLLPDCCRNLARVEEDFAAASDGVAEFKGLIAASWHRLAVMLIVSHAEALGSRVNQVLHWRSVLPSEGKPGTLTTSSGKVTEESFSEGVCAPPRQFVQALGNMEVV